MANITASAGSQIGDENGGPMRYPYIPVSLGNRPEFENSDIIDVVSVRDASWQSNSNMSEDSIRPISSELQQKIENSLNQFYPVSMAQRTKLLSQHLFGKDLARFSDIESLERNSSTDIPTSIDNGSLDLSTKSKNLISFRPQTPSESSFVPIHLAPTHPSCDPNKMSQVPTPSRAHCSINQQSGSGSAFLPAAAVKSTESANRSETIRSELGLPPTNLPPHILAWLLSSHLNPMQQAQVISLSCSLKLFRIALFILP